MKKIVLGLFLFLVPFFVNAEEDNNSGLNLASNAKSAIMVETSTGKVIYEKNVDEQLPMASMTKMMTLLLIMENIESGNLKWDEMVTTSEHAASMGGSQIFLEVGEKMSVRDLVKGICIGSGNDVAVIKKQSQVYKRRNNNITTLKPYVLEYYYKLYIKL